MKQLALIIALATLSIAQAGYDEPWRLQFHFTPEKNFMNDPNGLVFYKGEYHLFYQYNPFGNKWGHMSWGHAVSRDLIHWEHLPVALAEEKGEMIFSGGAVVDVNNTSGLCKPTSPRDRSCLIAIYTGHTDKKQVQNIAYSNDRGRTWTKYAGNPVIDIGYKDFRDPKVFWHGPSRRWVMAVSLSTEKKVRFYGSRDLKKWIALSDFGPAGVRDGLWECPDLFELPVDGSPRRKKWVLIVNVNPGGPAGGSGVQYFIGAFDGRKFTSDNPSDKILYADYGKDFYAAVSWSDIPKTDGRRIWIGWMMNWQYANEEPSETWRGAMSLPRVLSLKKFPDGIKLVQQPIVASRVNRLISQQLSGEGVASINSFLPSMFAGGDAMDIEAEFEVGAASEFGIKVRKGETEETIIGYDAARQQLFIDRTKSGEVGFKPGFPGRHAAPMKPTGNKIRLDIFVDRSSVEVFGNDGEVVLTDRIFPRGRSRGLELYEVGGKANVIGFSIAKVKSVWTTTKGEMKRNE
ncbi:MAG: glycoside hydrolase family 32 protein [Blastocatellia bacterium]